MKKGISFVVLILLASNILANDFGFRFGLKFSPNFAWFRTETRFYENDGVGLGYSYGLIIDYEFAENYAITTGLNIIQTGGKMTYPWQEHIEGSLVQFDKHRDHRYRHLEIPLALKLRTVEVGYITYYGKFGVGLGFLTSAFADEELRFTDRPKEFEPTVDINDETSFFRAGLLIGAGAEYNFGGLTSLLFGITFHNGFSNVLEYRNDAVPYTPSAYSMYLELTLGVMF